MSSIAQRILVAFDFSPPSLRALELANDIRKATGARVDVVHVVHDPYEGLEHPPRDSLWPDPLETEKYLDSLRTHLRAEVEGIFGADAKAVTQHVIRGDIDEEIIAVADQIGADLVIVGTKGKRALDRILIGSVSNRILHHAKVPVLTVP